MADLPLPVGSDEERPQSDAALWATHEAMRLGEMLDGGIDNWEEKERRLMSNPEVQATHLQWAQEFPEVEEDELEAPPGIPSPAPPPPSGPPPDEEDDDDHDDLVMSQDAPDVPPPPPGVPSLSLDDLSAHEDDDEHYHDDDEHELDENYTDRTNEEYTSRTDEDYTSRTNEEYSEDAASESDSASASDEEMQPTRSVSDPLLGESKPSPSPGRRRGRSRTRRRRRRHSASADSRSRSVSKSQSRGRSLSTSTPADKQITPRSAKTRPRRLKKRQLKRIQTARRAPRRPKAKSLSTTDKPKRPKSDRSSKRKGRRRVNRKRLEELSQPKSQPVLRERWTRRAASSADISKPTKRKPKSRRSKRSSMPDISAPAPDGSQSPPTESRSRKGSDASDRPRWNHSVRPRPIERVGSILSKDGSMLPTSPSSKKRDFKPSPFAPGYVDEAYTADAGGDSGAPVVLEVGRGSLRVAGFGDLTKAAPGSHLVHEVVEEERTGEDSSTSDGEPDADPAGASTLTEDSEALLEEAGALKVRDIKPSPMTKEALRDSESDRIDSAGAEYVQELVTRLRRALLESNGLLLESEKDRVSLAVINSRLQVHVAELGSRHQKELELLQAKLQQRETQLIEAAQSHNVLKIRLAQAKGTVHDQMNTISFLETRLTALGEDGLSSDASLSTKEQLLRRQNEAMEQQLQEMTEYLEEMTGSMESTKQSTRKRDKQFEHKLLRREKKHASKLKRMQEHQENLQAAVAEYSEMLQLGDEEKAELLEQIRLLEAELHQREHEYENSRSSFTELQAAMQKETDELRERLAEWETKDAEFTRAESALQEEKAALLSKVEQLEVEAGKASQVDELQAQLHDLEAARAAVHAQHAQAAAQVAELHAKVAEAQEKHFRELEERAAVESELRAEHDRTEQNLAALTEQHRESETERERHRREAEQHRSEAEQHRSEAEQHRAAAERHEAALRKVQQEAAMHEAALRQLEHEREELTSHASGKDSKYQESMREMRASMQATIDSLRATHREERAEYERLLDEVRATCDSQVQQIADLKRQEHAPQPAAPVPDQAAADQELLAELLAAQRAQRAAEKKLSERDAQVEDMQDTIQMLEQSEKQLASGAALAREEMEKLEFDLTQAKRARNEDVKRVSALEIELKAKEQELSVSSKTLELALQRAEDAEKRSAALAMEVSSVKETKSELEAHLVLANTALGEPDVPEIAPVTPDHIQRGACTNDRGQCDPCVIS